MHGRLDLTRSDVLRRAAMIIEQRGHCKSAYTDETGGVCLVAAVALAAREAHGPDVWPMDPMVHRDAMPYLGDFFPWACFYNNLPTTTGARVAARLREMAEEHHAV